MGAGSRGRERRGVGEARELRTWQKRWITQLALGHLCTRNSWATGMLVWGGTPKHLGEPGSMRKMRQKERLGN